MHVPVLQKEVLHYLDPQPNENFIDCTIGEGGHSAAILEKNGPKGKVLGIEWDPELYNQLKERCSRWNLEQRLVLVNDSFTNLKEIVKKAQTGRFAPCNRSAIKKFRPVSGILFDLGLSSWHLEESGRGFSFLRNEILDMRYNPETRAQNNFVLGRAHKVCAPNPLTAEKILNFWSKYEIEKILKEYGEERFAKRIAEKIVEDRKIKPIKKTFQLVEIIKEAVPKRYLRGRIHFATRTFQALRIAVNDELNNLRTALPQALEILKPQGKLVVISFHSLEDRIVKNFYRAHSSINKLNVLTKKPIVPSKREIKINPRSRSAKLRAALKIEHE